MKKNKTRHLKTKNYQLFTKNKAFTLIELLVVCTIIVLLTLIVVVNLDKARAKSRDVQREADLTKIAAALEMYKVEHKVYIVGAFATAINTSLASLIDDNGATAGGNSYIASIPVDPTNSGSYKYQYRGDTTQFKVRTFSEASGADYHQAVCWNPEDVKKKLGDFYDPGNCQFIQVSSSTTALNWN